LTTKDYKLVARLRDKMGDNPTKVVDTTDKGKVIYLDGVATTVTDQHLGLVVADQSKWTWTDDELLSQINSSRIQLFKGRKTDNLQLSEFEDECVLLQARIELVTQLATNSTKYAKYNLVNTEVARTSPDEYLTLARGLKSMLKDMLEEGNDSDDIGATVQQGFTTRFDRQRGEYAQEKFLNVPNNIPFDLSVCSTGIQIDIHRTFIPNYQFHLLKKGIEPFEGDIIHVFEDLTDFRLIDENVSSGNTYRYTLIVTDMNGKTNKQSKTILY
jgi:hypothetical protein